MKGPGLGAESTESVLSLVQWPGWLPGSHPVDVTVSIHEVEFPSG